MRISIITLGLIFSISSFASSKESKEITELFAKYDQVMQAHKTELVDEVFTKKFLDESGGKKEFIEKVEELPVPKSGKVIQTNVSWKKGIKNEIFFASPKEVSFSKNKSKKVEHSGSQFILVRENGKLKIDGTLSDAD